jgi:O-antigen/teichoic acid export membrane protein
MAFARFRYNGSHSLMSIGLTVTKGAAWNTVTTLGEKVIILANVFITLSFLTIHEYGLVQLVLSTVSIATIALLPGFSDAITADLAVEHGRKELGRAKEVLLQYNGLIMLLSVIAWAVLFFGSGLIVHVSGGVLAARYVRIASFGLLLSPLRTALNMLFTVALKFREQALYSVVEEIAKLAGLVLLVVWFRLGIEGLLVATVLSQLIAILVFLPFGLPLANEILRTPSEAMGPFWKSLSKHRAWSIANSYVGTVLANTQVWITKVLLGTDAVALFSVAQGLVAQVTSLLPLSIVIVPILPRYIDKPEEFRRALRTSMKVQLASAVGLVVLGAVGGPILIHILFPKYVPSLGLYLLLLIGIIPGASNVLLTPVFATLKRQNSFFYSSLIKLVLTIVLFRASIYAFGIWGTAVGSVLAALLSTFERQNRLHRIAPEYALETKRFFSLDHEERIFAASLLKTLRERWLRVFA